MSSSNVRGRKRDSGSRRGASSASIGAHRAFAALSMVVAMGMPARSAVAQEGPDTTAHDSRHAFRCRHADRPIGIITAVFGGMGFLMGFLHAGLGGAHAQRDAILGGVIGAGAGAALDYEAWRHCHPGEDAGDAMPRPRPPPS